MIRLLNNNTKRLKLTTINQILTTQTNTKKFVWSPDIVSNLLQHGSQQLNLDLIWMSQQKSLQMKKMMTKTKIKTNITDLKMQTLKFNRFRLTQRKNRFPKLPQKMILILSPLNLIQIKPFNQSIRLIEVVLLKLNL